MNYRAVQAGSDRVLEVMKREYTVADFRRVVDYLYAHVCTRSVCLGSKLALLNGCLKLARQVPGMTIATDVICGFPTGMFGGVRRPCASVSQNTDALQRRQKNSTRRWR